MFLCRVNSGEEDTGSLCDISPLFGTLPSSGFGGNDRPLERRVLETWNQISLLEVTSHLYGMT